MLMDALDLVEAELEAIEERKAVLLAKSKLSGKPSTEEAVSKNPTLQGLSPYKYFAKCLRGIKAPDMEQALMVLPFHYVARIVPILLKVTTGGRIGRAVISLTSPVCYYPAHAHNCCTSPSHSLLYRAHRLPLPCLLLSSPRVMCIHAQP